QHQRERGPPPRPAGDLRRAARGHRGGGVPGGIAAARPAGGASEGPGGLWPASGQWRGPRGRARGGRVQAGRVAGAGAFFGGPRADRRRGGGYAWWLRTVQAPVSLPGPGLGGWMATGEPQEPTGNVAKAQLTQPNRRSHGPASSSEAVHAPLFSI